MPELPEVPLYDQGNRSGGSLPDGDGSPDVDADGIAPDLVRDLRVVGRNEILETSVLTPAA